MIKIWIPILFNILVLLDVQADLPETSRFFSVQMALLSTFFQRFTVLGMYNFGEGIKSVGRAGLKRRTKNWDDPIYDHNS